MKHARLPAVVIGVLATAVAAVAPAAANAATADVAHVGTVGTVVNVCGSAPAGVARCLAELRTDVHGGRGVRGPLTASALPDGYGPADLRAAYALPATGGAGQTVGIVDAGDDPNAEADLATYRSTYGLPACTTANGCFRKVNQEGKPSPLPQDQGWAIEIALDLDMVSAACPSCHIVLVEGNTPTFADLAASEDTAVSLGANEVSNSYGGVEQNGMQQYAADYAHSGVAIVASSGDAGYGVPNFPAVLPSVVAVGGTSLTKAKNARGWSESAWQGASSGCSAWIDKPAWQHDANCPGRMVADVAADADPDTGPAVYDTDQESGWLVVGGTSASSPFIAGVIAQGGHPGRFGDASYLYAHASTLNDVVSGNNITGVDCGGDYQCTAGTGYDGPTGNGTPNGLGAF